MDFFSPPSIPVSKYQDGVALPPFNPVAICHNALFCLPPGKHQNFVAIYDILSNVLTHTKHLVAVFLNESGQGRENRNERSSSHMEKSV